jgi:hypothetical protein
MNPKKPKISSISISKKQESLLSKTFFDDDQYWHDQKTEKSLKKTFFLKPKTCFVSWCFFFYKKVKKTNKKTKKLACCFQKK